MKIVYVSTHFVFDRYFAPTGVNCSFEWILSGERLSAVDIDWGVPEGDGRTSIGEESTSLKAIVSVNGVDALFKACSILSLSFTFSDGTSG